MDNRFKTAVLLIPLSTLFFIFAHIFRDSSLRTNVTRLWHVASFNQADLRIDNYRCFQDYSIELLSIDPLVIYINNFLGNEEIEYLLSTKEADYEHSRVLTDEQVQVIDDKVRTSSSAGFSRDNIVASCLKEKMRKILGNVQHIDIEPIQIVKYDVGDKFRIHFDWFPTPQNTTIDATNEKRRWNRLVSIFAYLDDNCTGGETYFPELAPVLNSADETKFARSDYNRGLFIKPKRGNAIFWNNLHANGSGDPRVAHAGLPVHSGTKIGVNIWSHYLFDEPMVGGMA